MTPQIIVLPFAVYDIRESKEYYREQSQKAADDFINSINSSFIAIKENPKTYPIVKPEIRKYIIRKFPFSIFYIVRINIIYILAVFHNKRNPIIWEKRQLPNN